MSDTHKRKPDTHSLFCSKKVQARNSLTRSPTEAMLDVIFERNRQKFLRFLARVIANDMTNPPSPKN